MKTFKEFIFDSYKPILINFQFILENFVHGNISVDNFLFLLEGEFQSENAFRYIWNLASTDSEIKDLLNQASSLLHGVDAAEPQKYVKKVSDEWKSWEERHKSLRNRIKEIRSSSEISGREKGRQIKAIESEIKSHNNSEPQKYSSRKGSKEISPEWRDWDLSRSENPEEDQKSAKELMSRISLIMRDKISAAKNDPNNSLNFNNADPLDFTKGKTANDAESYYDNLEANIDAVSISPAYRELRGKSGNWSAERTGNAQAKLSKQAKLGDISQGYQPSPKNENESNSEYRARLKRERKDHEQGIISTIQKSDATLRDPSNPLSYIGISHKKGSYQLSAGEPRELLSVAKSAAKEVAKKEIQIPQGVNVTKELKDEIKRKREERVEELMSHVRRVADITNYRGRDKAEVERRKEEAQSILNDLADKEPGFIASYTARQKTGKDRYSSQIGTANVMVQVPDPKLSTERNPQGTEISTTANRGAEKIVPLSTSGGKSSSSGSPRPMTNRQRRGFAPKTSIQDLELPQAGTNQQRTFKDFSAEITAAEAQAKAKAQAEAEAQHSQTTAELEQQANQANTNVSTAQAEVDKANDPSELRYVDGTEPLIQNRKRFQDFIGRHSTDPTVQHIVQARTMAQDNLTSAQSVANDATTSYQTHISTPPTVQPTQPEQPQQPVQTPPQQPVQQKPAPEQPPAPQPAPEQPPAPQPAPEQPPAPQPAPEQPPASQQKKKKEEKKPPVEIAPEQGQ